MTDVALKNIRFDVPYNVFMNHFAEIEQIIQPTPAAFVTRQQQSYWYKINLVSSIDTLVEVFSILLTLTQMHLHPVLATFLIRESILCHPPHVSSVVVLAFWYSYLRM